MVSLLCFNIGRCLFAELNLAVWLPINLVLLYQIIQLYSSLYTQILCRNGYYINATLCGMYLLHIYLLEFATFEPFLRSLRLIISNLLYQAPSGPAVDCSTWLRKFLTYYACSYLLCFVVLFQTHLLVWEWVSQLTHLCPDRLLLSTGYFSPGWPQHHIW